jgi:hypothetical protein
MKTFLNADAQKNKVENIITGEIHTSIEKNSSIELDHDIFFADGLVIKKVEGDAVTLLVINGDYDLEDLDDIATNASESNCFKRIRFHKSFYKIKVSYHAYGDIIKAEYLNNINSRLDSLEGVSSLNTTKRVIKGDGSATCFTISSLPKTANKFEFRLNYIPLEAQDYSWNIEETTGTLQIIGFVPLPEDTIEITFRS